VASVGHGGRVQSGDGDGGGGQLSGCAEHTCPAVAVLVKVRAGAGLRVGHGGTKASWRQSGRMQAGRRWRGGAVASGGDRDGGCEETV
jgi:hypothetical protein